MYLPWWQTALKNERGKNTFPLYLLDQRGPFPRWFGQKVRLSLEDLDVHTMTTTSAMKLPKWGWPQGKTGETKTGISLYTCQLMSMGRVWGLFSSSVYKTGEYFSEFSYMYPLCSLGLSLPLGQNWKKQEVKKQTKTPETHPPLLAIIQEWTSFPICLLLLTFSL